MNQGHIGTVALGATLRLALQCRNGSLVITSPDAAPTWSIYGADDTALLTGSLGSSDADSKTGFRTGNAAITAGNGFAAGGRYTIRYFYELSGTDYADVQTFNVV